MVTVSPKVDSIVVQQLARVVWEWAGKATLLPDVVVVLDQWTTSRRDHEYEESHLVVLLFSKSLSVAPEWAELWKDGCRVCRYRPAVWIENSPFFRLFVK